MSAPDAYAAAGMLLLAGAILIGVIVSAERRVAEAHREHEAALAGTYECVESLHRAVPALLIANERLGWWEHSIAGGER